MSLRLLPVKRGQSAEGLESLRQVQRSVVDDTHEHPSFEELLSQSAMSGNGILLDQG